MTDTRIQLVSTIISAKWICPVRPQNTVLEDHSIIIEASYKDCMKMIKRQQAELSDCQDVIRKINP